MVKAIAALLLLTALAGCSDEVEPTGSPPPTVSSRTQPSVIPLVTLQAPQSFPKACQQYLDRVTICAQRQTGAMANAIRAGAQQTQAAWTQMETGSPELAGACSTSLKAVTAQAAALNC